MTPPGPVRRAHPPPSRRFTTRRVPHFIHSFGSVRSVRFGSVHSFRTRRVASLFVASLFVAIRAIDRTTYRLDVRVVVVLIAAVPATKVEVFADVANIIVIEIPWRVVPNDDRATVRLFSNQTRECEVQGWI